MIRYLFNHLGEIEDIIDGAVLFLDYDGTLVPIKNRPAEAIATSDLLELLSLVAQNYETAIVSGRTLDSLKKMLNIDGLTLACLHGLQIEFSDGDNFIWKKAEKTRPILEKIKKDGIREFGKEKIYLEDKGLTFAFHYRSLPIEKVANAKKRFIDIIKKYDDNELEIIRGTKVLEARPKGWNKGKAVKLMLEKFDGYPIYIGDDETDEDAFRCLEDGITVLVSNSIHDTKANFYLKNCEEVLSFLYWLLEIKSIEKSD